MIEFFLGILIGGVGAIFYLVYNIGQMVQHLMMSLPLKSEAVEVYRANTPGEIGAGEQPVQAIGFSNDPQEGGDSG